MKAYSISAAFTTHKVEESREFYVRYFDARVAFDCGWYVVLEFGNETARLQFMSPQQSKQQVSDGTGLIYHFAVENVDEEYERLSGAGVRIVVPLEDHPWGDRGFAIEDPNGIGLYIYSKREPSDDFKPFFR